MSKITHVCFDIGGVANRELPREQVVSRGQEYFGQDFSGEKLREMMFPIIAKADIWREFQNGMIPAQRYLEFSLYTGGFAPSDQNKNNLRQLLEEWCGAPYQPILDLVDDLKRNSYHTSVLSNNNEIMYNTPGAEIKNRVDVSLSSHEILVSKPYWQAFAILRGKVKADSPGQVLFIDNKTENTEAAKEYGLQGFHFRSKEIGMDDAFEELVEELRRKGVCPSWQC